MRRFQLFEIEDQPWCPDFYRNYMVDYLRYASEALGLMKPVVPILERLLRNSGSARIVDLGSGGGGGLPSVARELGKRVPGLSIVLTDLYPNHQALARIASEMPEVFRWEARPVDARAAPADLEGLRTLFLAFHHFRPADAQAVLQGAVDNGAPIAVFEPLERNLLTFVKIAFSPFAALILTPFIRPYRWGRLVWTYLIPAVPFGVTFDGLVSVLRTYRPHEMQAMIRKVEGHDRYEWEIGSARAGLAVITFLIGSPKPVADVAAAAAGVPGNEAQSLDPKASSRPE